ncbi:tetratricopeptide repeat protein [Prochlorococcus marinus]|uniref:tetratricopeptide repeat protein n=1 Tax=Prochlorococcus marinus TaxID=1219 RepID=UPI0022B5395B|nr:tetratricopeptide repeat protein [Prochlorococcus marinus]
MQTHKKEGISKAKTFTIPFTLQEIKDNSIIITSSESKLSKEKIIKQAFKSHSENNIPEAVKYYQLFINQGFEDSRVFSNYGIILKGFGKLKEAELLYRKAIKINPEFSDAYLNLGDLLRDIGELKDAEIYTNKAISINPNFADAHCNLGSILRDVGKSHEAEIAYIKAIEINPNFTEAYLYLGNILRDRGNLQEAESYTRKAIEIRPDCADAHCNLGSILKDHGKLEDAEIACLKAIELAPDLAFAHLNLGSIFKDLGKLQEAELSTRKAIELKPDFTNAHLHLGNILRDLGKLQEAELSTRKAIELKPDFSYAHLHLGNILRDLGKLKEAELSTRKAIELTPKSADAHLNLGNILRDLGKTEQAELSYRNAINIKPDFANAYSNLGNILRELRKSQEAELYTRKAIKLVPDFAEFHSNLGNILRDLGNLKEAEISYLKAIELNPDLGIAHNNLGNILGELSKLQEAELYTRKAIKLMPDNVNAYNNLGNILRDLEKLDDAINIYKKAIKLNNQSSRAKLGLIETKGHICDWSDLDIQTIWLKNLGIEGSSTSPFGLLYFEDNPLNNLKRSKKYFKENFYRPTKKIKHTKKNIIHIGYFSADFRMHPVMQLIAPLLELHDKSRFKIYLYSFVKIEDEYTERARNSGCIFRNISEFNNTEAIALARSDEIDIAVDLMGYTKHNRFNIFSSRVAPIQINYLGYPSTVGSNIIDYIIADKIVIPDNYEKFYAEKILRMPNCYICNDDKIKIDKKLISRKDFNLPEKGFIFTCFNNNKKITPKEFDIWMRLLIKIKGSVLWLKQPNKLATDNLYREAEKRNVDPKRLIFANPVKFNLHLARHSLGDLGLDTFNFNGHKTTFDALSAGLPVLTKIGENFVARVSSSLLNSIGLPELITYNENEYEETALRLANNSDELFKLKSKLSKLMKEPTHFSSKLYTQDLETIYHNLVRKSF